MKPVYNRNTYLNNDIADIVQKMWVLGHIQAGYFSNVNKFIYLLQNPERELGDVVNPNFRARMMGMQLKYRKQNHCVYYANTI